MTQAARVDRRVLRLQTTSKLIALARAPDPAPRRESATQRRANPPCSDDAAGRTENVSVPGRELTLREAESRSYQVWRLSGGDGLENLVIRPAAALMPSCGPSRTSQPDHHDACPAGATHQPQAAGSTNHRHSRVAFAPSDTTVPRDGGSGRSPVIHDFESPPLGHVRTIASAPSRRGSRDRFKDGAATPKRATTECICPQAVTLRRGSGRQATLAVATKPRSREQLAQGRAWGSLLISEEALSDSGDAGSTQSWRPALRI
jgi:hypothetical protein